MEKDDFNTRRLIGKGAFSFVYCAQHKETGVKYATKRLKDKENFEEGLREGLREAEMLQSLDHEHIIKCYGWIKESLWLVLEYVKGCDLYQLVQDTEDNCTYIAENIVHKYFTQILSAVAYLHSKAIVHRDINAANIIINTKTQQAKLVDFGFAITIKPRVNDCETMTEFKTDNYELLQKICGTVYYVAPEIIKLAKPEFGVSNGYEFAIDMWSLGITLHLLLTRDYPFPTNNYSTVYKCVTQGKLSLAVHRLSDPARTFIKQLLVVNPQERITASNALLSEWIIKPPQ